MVHRCCHLDKKYITRLFRTLPTDSISSRTNVALQSPYRYSPTYFSTKFFNKSLVIVIQIQRMFKFFPRFIITLSIYLKKKARLSLSFVFVTDGGSFITNIRAAKNQKNSYLKNIKKFYQQKEDIENL